LLASHIIQYGIIGLVVGWACPAVSVVKLARTRCSRGDAIEHADIVERPALETAFFNPASRQDHSHSTCQTLELGRFEAGAAAENGHEQRRPFRGIFSFGLPV
jgi:hypothetical protein